jgi:outer membrane protein assembly factor BamE (lipoprotein component of BamABCDE complex)
MTTPNLPKMAAVSAAFLALVAPGCVHHSSDPSSRRLTHGAVQMSLKKGVTTQQQVIDAFGAPNITTMSSGGIEVWTYQRHATEGGARGAYATIGLAGFSSTGFESSSRNMTLIIKFDANKKVVDFDSMYSSF